MYPTKKEILTLLPTQPLPTLKTILSIQEWKKYNYFNNKNNKAKIEILHILIVILYNRYLKTKPYIPLAVFSQNGTRYQFNTKKSIITLDKNHPSIISTLHEFAHALYHYKPKTLTPEELTLINKLKPEFFACVWSINVFKTVWPRSFNKLTWSEHRLIKP